MIKPALKTLFNFQKGIFAFLNLKIVRWKKTIQKHRLTLVHWNTQVKIA